MNQNPELHEASKSIAALTADGMISLHTRAVCIIDVSRTTGCTLSEVTDEVERPTELYERAEDIG